MHICALCLSLFQIDSPESLQSPVKSHCDLNPRHASTFNAEGSAVRLSTHPLPTHEAVCVLIPRQEARQIVSKELMNMTARMADHKI